MIWKLLWIMLKRERGTHVAVVIFLLFGAGGISSLSIHEKSMYHPLTGSDPDIMGFSRPSAKHFLGTDYGGRDIFSQILAGSCNALVNGFWMWVFIAVPVSILAFIKAGLGYEPYLEHSPLYLFIFLPFCAIQLWFALALPINSMTGGNIISFAFYLILILPFLWLVTWKSFGHLLVNTIEESREKVSFLRLLFEIVPIFFLIILFVISWTNIANGQLSFFGLGNPNSATWGMMLQWCFSTGYLFNAPFWLLTPGFCSWLFSAVTFYIAWRGYETSSYQ
jgi:peptide/nickel transport system permease protein